MNVMCTLSKSHGLIRCSMSPFMTKRVQSKEYESQIILIQYGITWQNVIFKLNKQVFVVNVFEFKKYSNSNYNWIFDHNIRACLQPLCYGMICLIIVKKISAKTSCFDQKIILLWRHSWRILHVRRWWTQGRTSVPQATTMKLFVGVPPKKYCITICIRGFMKVEPVYFFAHMCLRVFNPSEIR